MLLCGVTAPCERLERRETTKAFHDINRLPKSALTSRYSGQPLGQPLTYDLNVNTGQSCHDLLGLS
jgi:hypothetical protein